VSTSPFTSKNIVASISNTYSQFQLSNDGMGESDLESNVVSISNFQDGNEIVANHTFLLPADSWKDLNMLDWVLSIKRSGEDSTEDLFNDLMIEQFNQKAKSGGIGKMAVSIISAGYDKIGSDSAIDRMIEKDDKKVDANLQAMREFYGAKQLEEMTPAEFYTNYKKFAAGVTF
jgi:hypothetical protein